MERHFAHTVKASTRRASPRAREDVEELEPSSLLTGVEGGAAVWGDCWEVPQSEVPRTAAGPSCSIPRCVTRRTKTCVHTKHPARASVHSSITHKRQRRSRSHGGHETWSVVVMDAAHRGQRSPSSRSSLRSPVRGGPTSGIPGPPWKKDQLSWATR